MTKSIFYLLIILTITFWLTQKITTKQITDFLYTPNQMTLTSSDFNNNDFIPAYFTCQDENLNPNLRISGTPENAESLVLIVDDPDAPGGTWYHWLMWDINPKVTEIPTEATPGVQGQNDFGNQRYNGPCPPLGVHRYFFRIYALNTILDLPPETDIKTLQSAIKDHVLDKAELVGIYQKQ